MTRKILIVDDDQKIRSLLKTYLEKNQYEVLLAHDGASFMAEFERHRDEISLCILDVMLPDTEGFTLCQSVRRRSEVPVIMLTASADETDRIVGLELGADDYLGKPFNPRELLARINAVLRRRPPPEAPGAPSKEPMTVSFGPFEFDLALRRLTKNGEQLPLTTGEFSMLKTLVRHPRQPLSRDKLAQLARGREFEPFDRSLDVQISRLRKMLEADPAQPRYIQTVWGVGYVFVPDENT